MMKIILLLLIILSVKVHAEAPDKHKVDSLNAVLKTSIPDSARAEAYFQLAWQYWDDYPDKALDYAKQCLALSEKCGYISGIGDACHVLAGVNWGRRKLLEALEWGKKALKFRLVTGNDKKVTRTLFALGITCDDLGDNEKALKYYFDGLSRAERIGDSNSAAGIYHNIGMIYDGAGNRKDAITYTKKALSINEKTGNKDWMGRNLIALGDYYSNSNDDESLQYYEQGRAVFLSIGQKEMYGMTLTAIGSVFTRKGRYSTAIDTLHKALSVFREIQNKNGVAWTYNCLGNSYIQQKKFKEAAVSLDSCLRLCRELGAAAMRNVYQRLYQLDSASGNLARAYTHYRLYITLRDSLNSTENIQTVAKQQLRFEYAKKEEREKAEQAKRDAVAEQELQRQKLMRNGFIGGFGIMLLFSGFILFQRNRISKEKKISENERERSDNLLLNILPAEVAEELKEKGAAEAKHFDNVTVLFSDFVGFTKVSEALSPQELVNELHACFKGFDEICGKYNIEKIKTIGDAYLAVCGLPLADEKHAEKVVNAALEIRDFMANRSKEIEGKTFEIRIGINSGSVVAGIVGVKKFAYDIWGDTVNTAARMEQNSEAGKINISETTYELIRDNFTCEYRGEIDAKNKGKLKMYFVENDG
jgi:class 3 adenylate cyclase